MSGFRLAPIAKNQIDDINDDTAERWGEAQATRYTDALFAELARIASRRVAWRQIPRGFALIGFRETWRSHVIYWRLAADDEVEIMAVLHGKMDQLTRARAAFGQQGSSDLSNE